MALPAGLIDLGPDIRIAPIDDVASQQFVRARPRINHPANLGAEFFSAIPGEAIVRSRRLIWFKTKAATSEEAWEEIEVRQVPPVIAALAPFSDLPPRIELLRIAELQEGGVLGENKSPWMVATFGTYRTRQLTNQETLSLMELYHAAANSALGPAQRYAEATKEMDSGTLGSRGLANVILSYFLVVEEIARTEGLVKKFEGEAAELASDQVERLRNSLARETSLEIHTKHIRSTLRELESLEQRYLGQQIQKVSERLKMASDVLDDALAIARLRNTTLAHPGRESPESLDSWVKRSERVAREFLSAYIRSLAG